MSICRISLVALLVSGALNLNARNVVTDWNVIASATIVKNAGKASAASVVWFAYMSIGVYDAVSAITGTSRPFYFQGSASEDASVEAAAVAAAHRILANYFPSQQSSLDSQYTGSLLQIAANGDAKAAGVAVGEAAAAALIAARIGDGLEAAVTYTPGTGPGSWVPTPPAFAAPVAPWLGKMRPFTMSTAADHRPDGPPSLGSETWKRDYTLTRVLGGKVSDLRSATETEIGLFWTEHNGQQYARAFGYLADAYGLSVPETARMMAVLWTGLADSFIGCWDAKYTYGFWRPVTAIQAGGGNSALTADPAWLSLGTTPGHPEYPSAHGCATGAVTTLIARYFGTTKVHVVVDSKRFRMASIRTRSRIRAISWMKSFGRGFSPVFITITRYRWAANWVRPWQPSCFATISAAPSREIDPELRSNYDKANSIVEHRRDAGDSQPGRR